MENNPTSKYDLLYFSNNNIYKQVDKTFENPNNDDDIIRIATNTLLL